jgi:MraZ protein
MFFGEFEYKVDEKGRVPIPPKFRTDLKGDGMILMPGLEPCITVYPNAEWKKISDELNKSQLSASKQRRLNRALFATAYSTKTDNQGRIILPVPLREHAGIIGDEVIMAGANNCFEIWNKEQWESEKAVSQEEAWQILESLEKR